MKTILIIDDEVFSAAHLGKLLERRGYQVITAATGEDGISLFARHRPDYVFLDIMLPGIDGEEVFRHIKGMDKDANVYFITGKDDYFSGADASSMGASGYLAKPVFPEQILRMLEKLDGVQAVSSPE